MKTKQSDKNLPEFITKQLVADAYGVCPRTVDRWMRENLIPFWKIGGTVRFRLAEIEKALGLYRVPAKFEKTGGAS